MYSRPIQRCCLGFSLLVFIVLLALLVFLLFEAVNSSLHCDAVRLYLINRYRILRRCSPKNSAFYTSLIIAAVTCRRTMFQHSISFFSRPSFIESFGGWSNTPALQCTNYESNKRLTNMACLIKRDALRTERYGSLITLLGPWEGMTIRSKFTESKS